MSEKTEFGGTGENDSLQHIAYVRQMLAELAQVARREKADLLAYLLEMAFTEASDLLNGRLEGVKVQRDQTTRMTVKPARKV